MHDLWWTEKKGKVHLDLYLLFALVEGFSSTSVALHNDTEW